MYVVCSRNLSAVLGETAHAHHWQLLFLGFRHHCKMGGSVAVACETVFFSSFILTYLSSRHTAVMSASVIPLNTPLRIPPTASQICAQEVNNTIQDEDTVKARSQGH